MLLGISGWLLGAFARQLLGVPQSHIERELRQLIHSNGTFFFYSNGGSWSLSKVPEVAANTCVAIEMQQNKPFATHF